MKTPAKPAEPEIYLERMLRVAYVAKMTNVSERTVWRDIRKGALRVVRTSGRVRVRLTDAKIYMGLSGH